MQWLAAGGAGTGSWSHCLGPVQPRPAQGRTSESYRQVRAAHEETHQSSHANSCGCFLNAMSRHQIFVIFIQYRQVQMHTVPEQYPLQLIYQLLVTAKFS